MKTKTKRGAIIKPYNGDGYWGECRGCGADGLWMIDTNDKDVIICVCGHEEVQK